MNQNIKAFATVCVIMFLAVSLLVSLLAIWDAISITQAKDYLLKIAYTFGAIFVVSGLVAVLKK